MRNSELLYRALPDVISITKNRTLIISSCFLLLSSAKRTPKFRIPNSELRIPNYAFRIESPITIEISPERSADFPELFSMMSLPESSISRAFPVRVCPSC